MITDSSFKKFLIVLYIASDPLYKLFANFFLFFFLNNVKLWDFLVVDRKGNAQERCYRQQPGGQHAPQENEHLFGELCSKGGQAPQVSVIFLLFFSLSHQLGFKNKSVFDERSNGIITLRLLRARLQLSRHHHLRIPQNSEWHNQCLPAYIWTLVNLWLC